MSEFRGILPEHRRARLKERLATGDRLRLIEAHSGLSGIVGDSALWETSSGTVQFDGLWLSSLTCSAVKGLPDVELNMMERRLETIDEVLTVTTKPVVVDGDTGGAEENFEYLCAKLESMGVSAVVIEDKTGPKRNSLSASARQIMEAPETFGRKIQRGKERLRSSDFLVFARIESLIAGLDVADAIQRARIYLEYGADGILIHSRERTPYQIVAFLDAYRKLCDEIGFRRPVLAVPTSYNLVPATALFQAGVDIVIYANHLLRATVAAMRIVCQQILEQDKSSEVEQHCVPIPDLFDMIGFSEIVRRDKAAV
ncbi:MAG: isocitrate lyase/phosphoenolpyruvate mutase family protein [Thermoanaerobaculia bacterium]